MPEDREEQKKKEIEDIEKEKKKTAPWYQKLPPIFLIIGAVIIYFAIKALTADGTNKRNIWLLIGGVLVLLYLLSKQAEPDPGIVPPEEAELFAEQAVIRKIKWGQYPTMTQYKIGPVSKLIYRDARPMYYAIGVKTWTKNTLAKFEIAIVQAKAPLRGFTTFENSIGEFTGRESDYRNQHVILNDVLKAARKEPFLQKFLGRGL